MNRVIASMSMSLDGFIADPAGGVDQLFGWMSAETSARYLRRSMAGVGALIAGRRLYDVAGGWGGAHPLGVPVVVVSHAPAPPFTTVDSVAKAVGLARQLAGGRDVVVAGARISQQCLDAGLLDAVHVDLVPVLLGEGVRWFENLRITPVRFHPPVVIEGSGVTHLTYRKEMS